MHYKTLISVPYAGNTYEVILSSPTILQINKVMEDSGMSREVHLTELPKALQEIILEKINETDV